MANLNENPSPLGQLLSSATPPPRGPRGRPPPQAQPQAQPQPAPTSQDSGQQAPTASTTTAATNKYADTQNATLENWQSELAKGDTDAQTREVGPKELVANQLNDLIASNSKYIQQARLGAREQASERGMLMSSVAAGAGERAAIDAALPIASQDASTYGRTAQDNMAAVNADRLADQGMYGNLLGQAVGIDSNIKEAARTRQWQSGENALNRASQEGIAGMQVAAQKAMQESQLAWQGAQNELQKAWSTAERESSQLWQADQNTLNRTFEEYKIASDQAFTSWQNDLNRNFQGDQNQLQFQQQRFLQFDQNMQNYNTQMMNTVAQIYSNPNLTATQQAAAAANAKATYESLYKSYGETMAAGIPEIYWTPYGSGG